MSTKYSYSKAISCPEVVKVNQIRPWPAYCFVPWPCIARPTIPLPFLAISTQSCTSLPFLTIPFFCIPDHRDHPLSFLLLIALHWVVHPSPTLTFLLLFPWLCCALPVPLMMLIAFRNSERSLEKTFSIPWQCSLFKSCHQGTRWLKSGCRAESYLDIFGYCWARQVLNNLFLHWLVDGSKCSVGVAGTMEKGQLRNRRKHIWT